MRQSRHRAKRLPKRPWYLLPAMHSRELHDKDGMRMRIGVISDTHGSVTAWRKAHDQLLKSADLIYMRATCSTMARGTPCPKGTTRLRSHGS